MKDFVWGVVQNNNRYLLIQNSMESAASGSWCFPGGEIDSNYMSASGAISRKLRYELGIQASGLIELFKVPIGDYNLQCFLCKSWSGKPYPASAEIAGLGFFTIPEIYNLGESLSPLLKQILPQFTFMIRHNHSYSDHKTKGGEGGADV
jgi:hypothetical protein